MFIGSLDLAVAGLVLGAGPIAERPDRQLARFLEQADAAVEVLLRGYATTESGAPGAKDGTEARDA
jgi:hypothetical protein